MSKMFAVVLALITVVAGTMAAVVPAQAATPFRAAPKAVVAPATYADYSRIFSNSAGNFYDTAGNWSGQWAWRTENATTASITWSSDPNEREYFKRSADGKWLLLDGWSANGTYYRQRVTSEKKGDASCRNMLPVASEGGLQHYVQWTIPTTAYCLEAKGTITEELTGKVINFQHTQIWSPAATCSNTYHSNRSCIKQNERWWDDNQHAFALTLNRDNYLAKDLGMAFKVVNYDLVQPGKIVWQANGRNYWTWQ